MGDLFHKDVLFQSPSSRGRSCDDPHLDEARLDDLEVSIPFISGKVLRPAASTSATSRRFNPLHLGEGPATGALVRSARQQGEVSIPFISGKVLRRHLPRGGARPAAAVSIPFISGKVLRLVCSMGDLFHKDVLFQSPSSRGRSCDFIKPVP